MHACSFVFIGLTSFLCNESTPSLVPRSPHWRPSDPFLHAGSDHKLDDGKV